MNIRSVTIGVNPESFLNSHFMEELLEFKNFFTNEAKAKKINIKTFRFTLSPINLNKNFSDAYVRSTLNAFDEINTKLQFRWYCVPFIFGVNDQNDLLSLKVAFNTLKFFNSSFVNLILDYDLLANKKLINNFSKFILKVSSISSNGFDNFRVGISTNIKSNVPFFPFSYHDGNLPSFSIALESLEFILNKQTDLKNLSQDDLEKVLTSSLSDEIESLNSFFLEIEKKTSIGFKGIDASFAPYPDDINSVAKLVEIIGGDSFGANGTLYITSFLTGLLKKIISNKKIKSIGFNGVMYSLLEDHILALRNNQKIYTLDSLLLYSTLCGCGLDMVPVPGNILPEEISSLILDTASIAYKLNKPLGVRILPIPNKQENEMTDFNHDFIIDTRLMNIRNMSLGL